MKTVQHLLTLAFVLFAMTARGDDSTIADLVAADATAQPIRIIKAGVIPEPKADATPDTSQLLAAVHQLSMQVEYLATQQQVALSAVGPVMLASGGHRLKAAGDCGAAAACESQVAVSQSVAYAATPFVTTEAAGVAAAFPNFPTLAAKGAKVRVVCINGQSALAIEPKRSVFARIVALLSW